MIFGLIHLSSVEYGTVFVLQVQYLIIVYKNVLWLILTALRFSLKLNIQDISFPRGKER